MADQNTDNLPDIIDEPPIQEERALTTVDRSATALAAQARASIQARVWLALERPRQLPRVRDIILAQVKRPALAAKAVYAIQRGNKKIVGVGGREEWVPNMVEGPSIKLANALRIAMTNIGTADRVIADDGDTRTIEVEAIDYETNSSETRSVVVSKTVERKGGRGGSPPDREIISSRKNSYGEQVYKCRATEAEIQEAQNSAAARARRNVILAIVPADIVEDAVKLAKQIAASTIAQTRQATIERLKGSLAKGGISQADIADYLGRAVDDATAEDLLGLEMLVNAIADGHTSWKAAVKARAEARASESDSEPDEPAAPPAKGAKGLRSVVEAATRKDPT